MVKNRQKGITKAYRNDKKDVNTRVPSPIFPFNNRHLPEKKKKKKGIVT